MQNDSLNPSTRTIGVVGGGTAGYLTALAIRRKLPSVRVTVLESSRVPIIGVGESSWHSIVRFLHEYLGCDIHTFYREVKPTWKLGIRFEWGTPEADFFNYPFDIVHSLASRELFGTTRMGALSSVVMSAGRVPVLAASLNNGKPQWLPGCGSYAYHLDNIQLIAYLRRRLEAHQVAIENVTLDTVETDAKQDRVVCLRDTDGNAHCFDLYVDCSGFRSLLLGEALKVPFVDYGASLFTNRAWAGNIPHGGNILPYTSAITMKNGWMWKIPLPDSDHVGYVFSNAFCSEEKALDEFQSRHPDLYNVRLVPFTSGRRDVVWKNNVVAVGNASGFVEPLESTGLHMIMITIERLITALLESDQPERNRVAINREIARKWDSIRDFLAVHYRFNHKVASDFWTACHHQIELAGAGELHSLFLERGPLKQLNPADYPALDALMRHSIFRANGYDLFFASQGICPRQTNTRSLAETGKLLRKKLPLWNAVARESVSMTELLSAIDTSDPHLLSSLYESHPSTSRTHDVR